MSLTILTHNSPGAPPMYGANGAMCNVLDWALVQAGWAIEFTSGNARVYRAGTGRRRRLHINHDSAASGSANRCIVRGCESAASATSLTDPFPTTTQVVDANCNWMTSSTTDSINARPYTIYLSETWFAIFIDTSSADMYWTMGFFGDVPPLFPSDTWNTIIIVRNSSAVTTASTSTTGIGIPTSPMIVANSQLFWCRSADGSVKSSQGCLNISGTTMGVVTGCGQPRTGYQNRIYRQKVRISCSGSQTTTVNSTLSLLGRGSLPNIWNPCHTGIGAYTSNDIFKDDDYDPAAVFRMYRASANTTSGAVLIVEETDTWDDSP